MRSFKILCSLLIVVTSVVLAFSFILSNRIMFNETQAINRVSYIEQEIVKSSKSSLSKNDIVKDKVDKKDFAVGFSSSKSLSDEEILETIAKTVDNNSNNEKPKQTDTVPSRNYTVVIDPGHGGIDPGSIGYKTKVHEDKLNLKMSLKLKEKLEKAGINVVMTRETDEGLADGSGKSFKKRDMALRKELIKNIRPNMVISLHQNSYTNHKLRGAQVFYDKTSDISKQIAQHIQDEFLKDLEHSNKYISPGDYFMLKCTTAPSVIVECGFLSNEEDEKLLISESYQDKITDCIYKAIVRFLQIK
ncbi:MAG: N-acetylmuramoyl-L-alanine amidase [Clostridia bacterium]|nr:N-acetylmuramoyl-L-alanine amidase [Clostridia bacterium]